jgi:hypothetical protein
MLKIIKRELVLYCFCLILTSLVLFVGSAGAIGENTANLNSSLGTNLGQFASHNPGWEFVDIFSKALRWRSSYSPDGEWGEGPELDLDDHGWVRSLPEGVQANTLILYESNGEYPAGEYVVLWEGEGSFDILGDAHFYHHEGDPVDQVDGLNRATFMIENPTNNGIYLRIRSVAEDYIRNIRIIVPGGICGQIAVTLIISKAARTQEVEPVHVIVVKNALILKRFSGTGSEIQRV